MKKIVLIDGNSLMFRSFYATARPDVTGKFSNIMTNSKGLYTNAIYAFSNMLTSILQKTPEHVFVLFDAGKSTFRHKSFDDYKGGRKKLPEELRVQIPYIKLFLDKLAIHHQESLDYEADDLIASTAKLALDSGYKVEVISGDKDLLQLVKENCTVFLTRSGVKELEEFNVENFYEKMNITPSQITDYKGLVGDTSDNLPGIKGVGDKTAIKLLNEYKTCEGIYENIDKIKGKMHDTILNGKEMCLKCKFLATLYYESPIDYTLDELEYSYNVTNELIDFYKEMEFESIIKKLQTQSAKVEAKKEFDYIEVVNNDFVDIKEEGYIIPEVFLNNYYSDQILGFSIVTNSKNYFVSCYNDSINSYLNSASNLNTFDYKKLYVVLKRMGYSIKEVSYDMLLASYLINPNYSSDDIKNVCNYFDDSNNLLYVEQVYGANTKIKIPSKEEYINYSLSKCECVKALKETLVSKIKEIEAFDLFSLEIKLSEVLANMELAGLRVDKETLDDISVDFKLKLEEIEDEIFTICKRPFNINSPKQLGEVLFEELKLPHGKKNKNGYSTSSDILEKLANDYEICKLILDYRAYSKLISTYINGLSDYIDENSLIHPLYKQALTQTGRLSSVEPNIQNIPVRTENGQQIRRAFTSRFEGGKILGCDYSQIELRMLANLSGDIVMQNSFNSGIDFHTKTASEIYEVDINEVTKDHRRFAKAINFGIVYGMSSWGLSEALKISQKEATTYIEKYFNTYNRTKEYLDELVNFARNNGYSKTIMNRRRYIDDINSSNINIRQFSERTSKNAPIQGSAADIIKLAMVNVYNKMKERNLKSVMIAQVHDELVFDCPLDEVDLMMRLVKDTMEEVMDLKVKLIAQASLGNNWFEAK